MRVAVVTHKQRGGYVLHVAEDWGTAQDWLDQSKYSEEETKIVNAKVHSDD